MLLRCCFAMKLAPVKLTYCAPMGRFASLQVLALVPSEINNSCVDELLTLVTFFWRKLNWILDSMSISQSAKEEVWHTEWWQKQNKNNLKKWFYEKKTKKKKSELKVKPPAGLNSLWPFFFPPRGQILSPSILSVFYFTVAECCCFCPRLLLLPIP